MRKRALSIMLCLALALSLAACGGGSDEDRDSSHKKDRDGQETVEPDTEKDRDEDEEDRDKDREPEDAPEPQEPDGTEPDATEPDDTEPDDTQPDGTEPTEPEEPEPAETQPTETAPEGSAFLALLQAEYQSDTALGLTGQHDYYDKWMIGNISYLFFVFGDSLYFYCDNDRTWFAYDLATKAQTQLTGPNMAENNLRFFLDGADYYFKFGDFSALIRDDLHGNTVNIKEYGDLSSVLYYGGGILCYNDNNNDTYLYTVDLQKIASIPAPQQEAAHGLTEAVQLEYRTFCAAGGKIYAMGRSNNSTHLYSLDPAAVAPEWTDLGELSAQPEIVQAFVQYGNDTGFQNFLGRYYYSPDDRCFYDITTGETEFELGELYAPVFGGKSYFGGDNYIGYKDKEYRMVNLANGTMSDPLTLPEKYNQLYFLTDTYCVYSDDYGIFLWNYLTGEETTIVMFERS